jgi:hypothetical protein
MGVFFFIWGKNVGKIKKRGLKVTNKKWGYIRKNV